MTWQDDPPEGGNPEDPPPGHPGGTPGDPGSPSGVPPWRRPEPPRQEPGAAEPASEEPGGAERAELPPQEQWREFDETPDMWASSAPQEITPGEETEYDGFGGRDRFRANVARITVIVSILGALVSWRASESAERADGFNQQAAQDRVLEEQARAADRSTVAQDQRIIARAEDRYRQAEILKADAEAAKGDLKQSLAFDARRADAEGDTLYRYLSAQFPQIEDDGNLIYDRNDAARALTAAKQDLQGLRPEEARKLGDDTQDEASNRVLVATLMVAALFFLTLAQLTRPGPRQIFAGAGVSVALAGGLLFFVL